MPFDDDLVDVTRLRGVEPPQSEIIDDEKVGGEEAPHGALPRVVGLGLMEFLEHPIGAQEENAPAGAAGGVPKAACEQRLADPDRAEEEDILRPVDESEAEEIAHAIAIEGDGSFPVEAFQCAHLVEVRPDQARGQVVLLSPIDLVLQNQLEEILRAQWGFLGVGRAVRQGRQDPRELEALEHRVQ